MFSQASVILSTGEGMCDKGGHAWQGGIHGKGACVVGGMHKQGACVAGGHAWQERRPLQRMVRILLKCF